MAGRPFKLPRGTGNDGRGQEQSLLEGAGRQDGLLSYLGRWVMMGEDRNGLPKGLEGAGRQDGLLSYILVCRYE